MDFSTDTHNPITLSLIRVMQQRLEKSRRPSQPKYPRYRIEREPYVAVHARDCLSAAERHELARLIDLVNDAETAEGKVAALHAIPLAMAKPVKIFRQHLIDHSKIYSGLGAKDRARRERALASQTALAA